MPIMCERAIIKYLEDDTLIRDYLRHFHDDDERQTPRIVVGFKQGDEHPSNSGIFKYEGEIAVRDNIQKTGSDKETLDNYVRHVHAKFVGVNLRALRQTLSDFIGGTFRVYGISHKGDGERTTSKTTRIHPIMIEMIAVMTG